MGIQILPPDVNLSDHKFVVVEGNIRFGLDAVKGVGYAAVEAIKRARGEDGPFHDLYDFCARVDCRAVNKKAIEALIKCGAFGSTGAARKGMLTVLEQAQGAGQKAQQDAQIGQGSIFDLGGSGAGGADGAPRAIDLPAHPPIPTEEFDRAQLLAAEKEAIGLFLSTHPLKEVGPALRERVDCSLSELAARRDGECVTVGGIVTEAKRIRTKKGDWMMFATLDDLDASVELIVFGGALESSDGALVPDTIVLVRGRVDHKDRDKTCLIVQQIERFEPSPEAILAAAAAQAQRAVPPQPLCLYLDTTVLPAGVLGELKELIAGYRGEADLVLELETSSGRRRLKLGPEFRVERCATLQAELRALFGEAILNGNGDAESAAEPRAQGSAAAAA
jgi:DNA polymerase-3 subunit alpha